MYSALWHSHHASIAELTPKIILAQVSAGLSHIAVDPFHVNQSAFQLYFMYIDNYFQCDCMFTKLIEIELGHFFCQF